MPQVCHSSVPAAYSFRACLGFQFVTGEIMGSDNVTANNFGVFDSALTVSVEGAESFIVKFRAAKAGKLSEMMSVSSRITKAEAYPASAPARQGSAGGEASAGKMDVALRFSSPAG
jgi:hypothetical protein